MTLAVTTMSGAGESGMGESLSGIFGCISLVAWICLLLPQLITNYRAQSADGLSMGFLFIWLLGDISNLSGALFTSIAPSAIAIACYFCVADIVLVSQCLYYNAINARLRRRDRFGSTSTDASEDQPLLGRGRSRSGGLPGSHRRRSFRRDSSGLDPLTRIVTGEDETPQRSAFLTNSLSLVAVYVLGVVAWFVSREVFPAGDGQQEAPIGSDPDGSVAEPTAALGLILGYSSAACYLCARLPQIYKNWQDRSTEGLAPLFFLLSMTGNLTYGASLVVYSQDAAYLLKALPWLLGSFGTIVEDSVIFVQFQLYSKENQVKFDVGEQQVDPPPYSA